MSLLLVLLLAPRGDVESMINLTELYAESGQHAEALEVYGLLRKAQPKSERWWREPADLLEKLGRDQALATTLQGWWRALDSEEALRRLFHLHERLADLRGAQTILGELLRRRPEDIDLLRQAAQLAEARRDQRAAKTAWQRVVKHPESRSADVAALAAYVVREPEPKAEPEPEPEPEGEGDLALREDQDRRGRLRRLWREVQP